MDKIKNQLLKEAQGRISFHSKGSDNPPSELNSIFFKEAQARVEKLADLEKESMAAQAGVLDVRNSTANTQFGRPIFSETGDQIESKLYEAYKKFFYEDISGMQHQIEGGIFIPDTNPGEYKKVPNSHFRIEFPFYRSIMPNHPNFQDNVNSVNEALERIAPELLDFRDDIESSNIPVLPYFHATSSRTTDKGGVNPEEAMKFVKDNYLRQQDIILPNGQPNPVGEFLFTDLMNRYNLGENLQMTKQHPHKRKYDRKFAKDLNIPPYILQAITYKILEGFRPDWYAFVADLEDQIEKLLDASRKAGVSGEQLEEKRRAYVAYFNNVYQKARQMIAEAVQPIDPNDSSDWYNLGDRRGFRITGKGKHAMPVDLPVMYFKLLLYHLTDKNPASKSDLGPNDFTIPSHKLKYSSNGMDSIPTNPNKNMPVIPSLRKFPNGQVWYDTDQINLGRQHLVHNGKNLEALLSKYGPICEQLFNKLSNSSASQENKAFRRAWNVVFRNRTNAESSLEVFNHFNNYQEFRNRFLNKSLASTYTGGRSLEDTKSLQNTVISEAGFMLLKRYGYYVSKMMDFISALAYSSSEEVITSREDNGQVIEEKFYGRTLATSTGKAGESRIIIGIRYANAAPLLGSNDPELRKIVDQYRTQEQASDEGGEYLRHTEHPQKAQQLGQEFQPNSTYKIIHDLRYFVGLSTSKANFMKAIGQDDYETWQEAVNVLMTRYPQIENEVGAIIEPMNANLKELSIRFKKALIKVQADLSSNRQSVEFVVDDKVTNTVDIIDPQLVASSSDIDLQENEIQQTISPDTSYMYPQNVNDDNVDLNMPEVVPSDLPDDNNMSANNPLQIESKPMMSNYVSKKDTSKRKLLKQRPTLDTGKLPKASIIDNLIKMSDKMDACGEYFLSDKLDFIIERIRE